MLQLKHDDPKAIDRIESIAKENNVPFKRHDLNSIEIDIATNPLGSIAFLGKSEGMRVSKFKIGDIVRYGPGSTALMEIQKISYNHGGHNRYYGKQFYGCSIGAYERDCSEATTKDLILWRNR